MTTRYTGRHRSRSGRQRSMPTIASGVTVAAVIAGAVTIPQAGAATGTSDTTIALDAPVRPVASTTATTQTDIFAGLDAATKDLANATKKASSATHEAVHAEQIARQRRLAAESAAREAEERARLAAMFTRPLDSYRLSAHYGVWGWQWSRGYHTGVDLTAAYGSPVKAVNSGTVTFAGWNGAYGYQVRIKHSDGSESSYAHLSGIAVGGGPVATGQVIGYVGSTGNSYGAHLHLEAHDASGRELNPYTWLQSKGITL